MGVLTDILVADRADSQRVCDSTCPSRDFAGLDAKGIDTTKIGKLDTILTGSEFKPSFMVDSECCSGGEDGPWVFEVPSDLVRRIAMLTDTQLQSAGEKWAATEEFSPRYDNWPVEDLQSFLREWAAMCKRAEAGGKAVLMWMCL
jgi:hypothetical protein